jgi:hypothetical protein
LEIGPQNLAIGSVTYFEFVDVSEALAFEFASVVRSKADKGAGRLVPPKVDKLKLRATIRNPYDLGARPIMGAVNTLTVRLDQEGSTFVMHHRDPAQVAVAGGMYHVIPAGMFQPPTLRLSDTSEERTVWHNIMREYHEELLGSSDAAGRAGAQIDYSQEPYRSLEAGVQAGRIRPYWLGAGLDPLTLAVELLTVVVFDADVFDEVLADAVLTNDEGTVIMGIPLEQDTVEAYTEQTRSQPTAPAAVAILNLVLHHRDSIGI